MIKKLAIKSVLACAFALGIAQNTHAVNITFDDFDVDEGHFNLAPGFSGSSVGEASTSTADRVTTDLPLEGAGHQKLVLISDGVATSMRIRHLSGSGTPANNVSFATSGAEDGWVGCYVKTTQPGWTVQIWLEGASNNGGVPKEVIADGEWHVYEWDLDNTAGDTNGWGAIAGILGGTAIVSDGNHTIDSVVFRHAASPPTSTLFMDFIAKSTSGSISNLLGEPCADTTGVLVTGPLSTNVNQVVVGSVSASATAVTVYQDSGSGMVSIGSKTTGITAGNNTVTVAGLVKNAQVTATQTVNGQESCIETVGNAVVPVGGGANPSVKIAVTVRETQSTGPVGSPGEIASGTIYHFLGASSVSGGAPIDAAVASPSTNWQTISIGGRERIDSSSNAVGGAVAGTTYGADQLVAIQVYAFRTVGDTLIFSPTPAQSASVTSNGNFAVNWTWAPVSGAEGYRVLRSVNDVGFLENIDVVSNSLNDTTPGNWGTTDTGVTPTSLALSPSIQWFPTVGNPNNIATPWGILESINFVIDGDSGPFDLYIDNMASGDTVFQTFEGITSGGLQHPSFSSSTSGGLLSAPNVGVVTNLTADTGTNSFRVRWQWNGTNSEKWLRLTTSGLGNPQVNLDDPISFRLLLLPVGSVITPPAQPPTIGHSLAGNQLTLTWTGTFNLQFKDNLSDATWTNVGVSNSPFTTNVVGAAKFFRLQKP